MARSHQERRGQTFRNVLVFTLRRWVKQSWRLSVVAAMALLSAGADVLTPMYAGRLVDALVSGSPGEQAVWHAALTAFWMLVALGGAAPCCARSRFATSFRLR